MARMHKWLGLSLLAFSLTGCVSAEQYQAQKLRADELGQQLAQASSDAKNARGQADAYKAQLDQIAQNGGTKDAMFANLNQQLATLTAQDSELRSKYEELLKSPPQIVQVGAPAALPQELNNELQAFANQNPGMVDFDAATGTVKFKSDVTFASGSTEVNSRAQDAIRQFAQILDSQAASSYQLMVAGHTDNTPVRRTDTINQGNFDNWYLSAHRAISVAAELVKNGVAKNRLGVAGYADQRPIASNLTSAGKAQNRRVEIMILPTTVKHQFASAGNATVAAEKRAPAAKHLDKDSLVADRPVLTK